VKYRTFVGPSRPLLQSASRRERGQDKTDGVGGVVLFFTLPYH
jgi:hypothetical protein